MEIKRTILMSLKAISTIAFIQQAWTLLVKIASNFFK